MASPLLFSTGATAAAPTSRNLVEFKAGKMEMREKMVHAIKRQGLVYLRQSQDDNLMHFCWKDRQTGVVEDDLILFPDDCEFKRVKECTTGRVYVLKMKSSNRKMFFWMQESRTDRDDEFCKKINEMLNNPPRPGADLGGGSSASDRDIQSLFGNMTPEQVSQLLNSNGVSLATLLNSASGRSPSSNSGASAGSAASTTNSSAPTSAQSGSLASSANAESASDAAAAAIAAAARGERDPNATMRDFRALFSGALAEGNEDAMMAASLAASLASSEGAAATAGAGAAESQERETTPLIDLSTAVNSESLAHLLNDEEFLRQVEPHLPPITQQQQQHGSNPQQALSAEDRKRQFAETIRSSQFRSSLSQFCVALQSGQLGPLMSQFGLNQACVDAANLGNLEAFVRALDAQHAGASASSGGADGLGSQPSSGEPKKE